MEKYVYWISNIQQQRENKKEELEDGDKNLGKENKILKWETDNWCEIRMRERGILRNS